MLGIQTRIILKGLSMKGSIVFILIFVMLAALSGCKKENEQEVKKDEVKSTDNVETIFAVNTTTAVKGEINDYIELNGDIKSKNQVDVYPDVMGKLVSIRNIGEYVTKGEWIAKVDQSKPGLSYELSLVLAPISGTIMEVSYQTGSTVSPQTSIIKIGLLKQIEIITNVSEKYISKMKTGLDCIIGIEAFPGINFHGNVTSLSPVVDPQTRMMEVKVGINDIDTRIKPGMFTKVKIITEKKVNVVKIPVDCSVKRFGEDFVFIVKREIPATIKGADLNGRIIKNLNSDDAVFILNACGVETKTIKLPKDNVMMNEIQSKVLMNLVDIKKDYQLSVNKENLDRLTSVLNSSGFFTVEKRKIKTGVQIDDKLEVTEGLDPGEEIVVRGQTLLEDKTRVKIIDRVEPLSSNDVIG
jgi:membrane fusion protein (multidrug efflux system)